MSLRANCRGRGTVLAAAIGCLVLSADAGMAKDGHRAAKATGEVGETAAPVKDNLAPPRGSSGVSSTAPAPSSALAVVHGPSGGQKDAIRDNATVPTGPRHPGVPPVSAPRMDRPATTAPPPGPPGPAHAGAGNSHIDLVTPDGGYGGPRRDARRTEHKGNTFAPLAPGHPAPRRPADTRAPLAPTRNAIGMPTGGAGSARHADAGPSAIGGAAPPAHVTSAAPAAISAVPLGAKPVDTGNPIPARPGIVAPLGGAPRAAAGINGTAMVRAGSAPAFIGGSAKPPAAINGTTIRPRR